MKPNPTMSDGFWTCSACDAQNSREDGECQFCDCDGASCERENCSTVGHVGIYYSDVGRGWFYERLGVDDVVLGPFVSRDAARRDAVSRAVLA